ncbi:MAG: FG-GAP-like repeat-containing protein [Actinomycetota bacterium]|nr:FG-GAP-like repeat-containing protein [Actinomycetota bacterium]
MGTDTASSNFAALIATTRAGIAQHRRIAYAVLAVSASISGALAFSASSAVAATQGLPTYTATPIFSPNPQATPDSVNVFSSGFGERLRTIGDVNGNGAKDILVANVHYNFSSTLTGVGRLWIFDGRTRELIRSIDDPAPQVNARFGFWSAALGDVNGDGVPDFVTSADGQNVGPNTNQGEVYIFSGRTGELLRTIDDPDPQASADFGGNIIAPGDLNGDGITDFVVTASKAAGGAGMGYAFSGADGHLLYRIPNPDIQLSSFGFGAAEAGDVNGDGIPDYQIGAPFYADGSVTQAGRSYIISGKDGTRLRTLVNPDPTAGARFGQADSDGQAVFDTNGDGVPDVYVDGFLANDGAVSQAGVGYLFDGATGNLLSRLHDPSPQVGGQFGTSDAPAGDLNKDGFPDLIVGQTPHHNPAAANTVSKATVFAGPGLTNILMTLADPQAQPNSDFGNSIASPGDVNGDGYPDYFIGARSADTDAGSNTGIVWAFMSSPPAILGGGSVAVNVSPPTISGSTVQGHTLTEAHGSWSNSPTGYAYQWQRCNSVGCVAITGATAQTYTLKAADVGSTIRVQETASNGAGAGGTADSLPTGIVKAVGPPAVTRYGVTNSTFAVGAAATPTSGSAAANKHPHGTTFRYTLSEAATVKIVIAERLPGRRKGKSCVAATTKPGHSKRCTRIVVVGTLRRMSHQGANKVAFSGRIGTKALKPGSYQATLTATDNAHKTSRAKTVTFTIVKG